MQGPHGRRGTPPRTDDSKKSCDLGGGTGCNNLGYFHEKGTVLEKDEKKAVDLYRKGSDEGSDSACTNARILAERMEAQKDARKPK
jgi:TPR repeat protein